MNFDSSVLDNLNITLLQAKKSNLYSEKLSSFSVPLNSIGELDQLPFTSKEDLRKHYPYGGLASPLEDVVEMHTTSGTTGIPSLSFFSMKDLEIASLAVSEAWKAFGLTNNSRVQFIMSYGLFSGAMLNTYALQKLGAFVIPSGIIPTVKQIKIMKDFAVDTLVATPGYLYYLSEYIEDNNISGLSIVRAIAAGEVYSDEVRDKIEKKLKIKIYDHYGLCEVYTGLAYECEKRQGLHILDDFVIAEIVDPVSRRVLPDGKYGELVLTSLRKKASPIIRYRTGDFTRIIRDKCDCGRKAVRIDRIKSRVDDLVFIKGIKVNPHELKDMIMEITKDFVYGNDFQLQVKKNSINYLPIICLTFKKPCKKFINKLQIEIANRLGLRFVIKHVEKEYFGRNSNLKVKIVEYV